MKLDMLTQKTTLPITVILAIIVFITSIFFTITLSHAVYANDSIPHCDELFGAGGNSDWENCINNVKNKCKANYPTKPDLYEICINGGSPESPIRPDGNTVGFETPEDGQGNENCQGVEIGLKVGCPERSDGSPILSYLTGIINFLGAGVGLVVTAMIIVGGIEYITAGGVPQKLEKGKSLIMNALIALGTFIFMYGILQWLIPGGIF